MTFTYANSRGNPQTLPIIRQNVILDRKTVSVSAAGAAVGFGTTVLEGLPEGNILLLGVLAYVQLSGTGSDPNLTQTWDGDFSIGTAATTDVTLSGAEVDLIASTPFGLATAEVSPRVRAVNSAQAILDNTGNTLRVNLNVLVDAVDITDGSTVVLTASGIVQLAYIVMLDN